MATIALSRGRSKSLTAGMSTQDSKAVTEDFMRAMAEPARAAAPVAPVPVVDAPRKYRSRFFYRLPESTQEEVTRLKAATANSRRKASQTLEDVIQRRVDVYKDEFPSHVTKNIDKVREFFLTEINPLLLASSTGAAQAQDVVQKMLGITVDGAPYVHFDKLVRRAVLARMTKFISSYFKVDAKALSIEPVAQPKEVVFLNGQGQAISRNQSPVPGAVRNGKANRPHRP